VASPIYLRPNLRHYILWVVAVDKIVVVKSTERLGCKNLLQRGPVKNKGVYFTPIVVKRTDEYISFRRWWRRNKGKERIPPNRSKWLTELYLTLYSLAYLTRQPDDDLFCYAHATRWPLGHTSRGQLEGGDQYGSLEAKNLHVLFKAKTAALFKESTEDLKKAQVEPWCDEWEVRSGDPLRVILGDAFQDVTCSLPT